VIGEFEENTRRAAAMRGSPGITIAIRAAPNAVICALI
jgi:hypothetical protein